MKDSIIRAQFPPAVRQQPCFCFDKKQRVISRQLSIQMGWIQLSYCVTIIWIWFVKDTDFVIGGVSRGGWEAIVQNRWRCVLQRALELMVRHRTARDNWEPDRIAWELSCNVIHHLDKSYRVVIKFGSRGIRIQSKLPLNKSPTLTNWLIVDETRRKKDIRTITLVGNASSGQVVSWIPWEPRDSCN